MEFIPYLLTTSSMIMVFCCLLGYRHAAVASAMLPNETDHLALLSFKSAITGDPFQFLNSWNESIHFCHWGGVSCSNLYKHRVESLSLDTKELVGELTPHIGNLSFLKILNLGNNFFTGEIPPDVSRLFMLQSLKLENNSFEGEIPPNLSNCSNLHNLNLTRNKLQGTIPAQFGSLEKLQILRLMKNNLTGEIPKSLGNLSSLETFDLRYNSFNGEIPSDLAQLQHLLRFGVDYNHLSGRIPPPLYNLSSLLIFTVRGNKKLHGSLPWDIGHTLPNLEWLYLGENRFAGTFPVSLLNCSKLLNLDLHGNMFIGPLPPDLGRLQSLSELHLGENNFGSGKGSQKNDLQFLSSLTNCTNLLILGIGENSLAGLLPNSIANLSCHLEHLCFSTTHIHGSIPSGIGNLVSLTILNLSQNDLSGHLPTTIGNLRQLRKLELEFNRLTGKVPSTLGNLTELTILFLHHNKFVGSIPYSLGNCKNLVLLDLSFNNFLGAIPIQLFELRSLSLYLNLSDNYLTGPLPSQVGKLINLMKLDVSNNNLSGGIPPTLGACVFLSVIRMQGNVFNRKIPESLNALRGIEFLDLSHNHLAGRIPPFLGNLPFLSFLNVSFNDLEGAVPREGIFRNTSVFEVDGNPKLCGGVSQLRLPLCPSFTSKRKRKNSTLKVIAPAIVGAVCLATLAYFLFIFWKRRISRTKALSTLSLNFGHFRISYAELLNATNNFSQTNLLGVGMHSSVYKGVLDQGGTVLAVKVLNLQHDGSSKGFTSECKVLRNVRHRNLVKILTSCSSVDSQGNDFKALVFEFMANGSLEKWLCPEADEHGELKNLELLQRLNIIIDVASALVHLHHHSQPTLVHCDLKPSNVLLDSEMTAHVGDFGLAKFLSPVSDELGQNLSSSLAVNGSIGYVAPEYGMGSEVSTEGDVYSYGILLIEIFTGKRPTDDLFKDGLTLHSYANISLPDRVVEIIDPRLLVEEGDGDRRQECLVAVLKIGVLCSMELPRDRIQMEDVLIDLSSIRDVYQGDRTRSHRT